MTDRCFADSPSPVGAVRLSVFRGGCGHRSCAGRRRRALDPDSKESHGGSGRPTRPRRAEAGRHRAAHPVAGGGSSAGGDGHAETTALADLAWLLDLVVAAVDRQLAGVVVHAAVAVADRAALHGCLLYTSP